MEAAGYPAQLISDSVDQTWLFADRQDGRLKIEESKSGFSCAGTHFGSFAELWLRTHAEGGFLSASAHLRPLFQQWALQPITQVSGPSEIHYGAQLQTMFEPMDLEAPILWPRFHGALVSQRERKLLVELEINIDKFLESSTWPVSAEEDEEKDWPESWSERWKSWAREKESFDAATQHAADAARDELAAAFETYRRAEAKAFERLIGKRDQAIRRRNRDEILRRQRLRESLLPKGLPQERVRSLACYRSHEDDLARRITEVIDPFDFSPRLITYDES